MPKFIYILFLLLTMSSCASIIHGPTQSISFSSQPSGAKITVDGKEYGVTPRTVDLRRKGRLKGEISTKTEYAVKIEMDGFYPYEIKLQREMDGWFLGNLLFGGLIGIIIDASNGAMYKLNPSQIVAQMGKATSSNSLRSKDDVLYVAVSLEIDPSWERIGTLQKISPSR